MLQWMGGSMRKVATSRKSTHSRQKQYFEQRKRQQQALRLEENFSVLQNKCAHRDEEPRSLDILSLINLETTSQQGHRNNTNAGNLWSFLGNQLLFTDLEVDSSQVNSRISKLPLAVNLQKTIRVYPKGPEATAISPKKSRVVNASQNITTTHTTSSDQDVIKKPTIPCEVTSFDTGILPNIDAHIGVSIFHLLGDDGPTSNLERGSVPEAHVAFSVGGLGRIGMETPAHSPKFQRDFPSTPKAPRRIHTFGEHKSVNYNLGFELDTVMRDIGMSQGRGSPKSSCISRGMLDELDDIKSTKLDETCSSLDFYDNEFYDFNCEEKSTCSYTEATFPILDENFLDEWEYDAAWKSELFNLDVCPAISPKAKRMEIRAEDHFPENIRTSAVVRSKRNDFSDVLFSMIYMLDLHHHQLRKSSMISDLKHLMAETEYDFPAFGVERHCANYKKGSGSKRMFDPHTRTFSETEDVQDSICLLSEESCSSTAAGDERIYELGSRSVRKRQSKRDKFQTSSKKYEAENEARYTGCGVCKQKKFYGAKSFMVVENQWNSKAGTCAERSSALQQVLEPECVSLFKEGYTSNKGASDPSSTGRTSIERNTSPNGNFNSEDDPFGSFKHDDYFAAEWDHRKPQSNFPSNHEPSKIISGQQSEFELRLLKPTEPFVETDSHSPNLFHADDFLKDSLFSSLPVKKDSGKLATFEKAENNVSSEKQTLSSENSITAIHADLEDDSGHSEHKSQYGGQKNENPSKEAEGALVVMEEGPARLQSCTDSKIGHSDSSPTSPPVCKKDSIKAKNGLQKTAVVSHENGSTETSYQVMLQSYVFQLLCVQKVLMEASGKDTKKVPTGSQAAHGISL